MAGAARGSSPTSSGCRSPAAVSTPARIGCRACSAGWASRSCRRRTGSSRRAPRKRRGSAAKSCASSGSDMSRIGKQPIDLPASVSVSLSPGRVMVNGPLGELTQDVPARMRIEQADGVITVTRPTERGDDRALHGLTRTLIANMVEGVTKGFEKRLELQGVGYRAALQGVDLRLDVGYSHPVVIKAPQGITFEVPTQTEVVVKGVDKQRVGQISAEVRKVRPPEPYKGKGIRYQGEYVRRKAGKRA